MLALQALPGVTGGAIEVDYAAGLGVNTRKYWRRVQGALSSCSTALAMDMFEDHLTKLRRAEDD